MSEGREYDESILNSDTGISSDSAHSLTLVLCSVCCCFFLNSQKETLLVVFFNVLATKMYIFKICESVK